MCCFTQTDRRNFRVKRQRERKEKKEKNLSRVFPLSFVKISTFMLHRRESESERERALMMMMMMMMRE